MLDVRDVNRHAVLHRYHTWQTCRQDPSSTHGILVTSTPASHFPLKAAGSSVFPLRGSLLGAS